MKKAVLLFALSFGLVAFLNAQNDCTGHSYADAAKVKKEQQVKYHDVNQANFTDCRKSGKKDEAVDFYSLDRLGELMARSDLSPTHNSQPKPGKVKYNQDLRDAFSSSGLIVCCIPPPEDDKHYNSAKNE